MWGNVLQWIKKENMLKNNFAVFNNNDTASTFFFYMKLINLSRANKNK